MCNQTYTESFCIGGNYYSADNFIDWIKYGQSITLEKKSAKLKCNLGDHSKVAPIPFILVSVFISLKFLFSNMAIEMHLFFVVHDHISNAI